MTGPLLIALSIVATLISLAATGPGWVLAVAAMLVGSLFHASVTRRAMACVLIISLTHALTTGPLSGADLPPLFLIGFVLAPFALAVLTLFQPRRTGSSQ
ncbi:hypothetical protein [Noviherbaspirillum aridicola]|uniref:Uncharacterized protein n=1 Tax=Noviherbaspirillum aridicola TaxID=2849687 RepID=A0ABQ4Q4G0_9BURK|nr:hypothetical protein [Noviherbaspirillum aridicola]GIZ52081.1 hypothetical protein NCCP691_20950 [Noviherbaspirillum aridicola]